MQTYTSAGPLGPPAGPGQDRLYTYVWANAALPLQQALLLQGGVQAGWMEDRRGAYAAHMLYQVRVIVAGEGDCSRQCRMRCDVLADICFAAHCICSSDPHPAEPNIQWMPHEASTRLLCLRSSLRKHLYALAYACMDDPGIMADACYLSTTCSTLRMFGRRSTVTVAS